MSTYSPASFPRRPSPKDSNPLAELKYQFELAYYRFEIITGQYVMSPGEKLAYNLVLFGFLGMLLVAVVYYLPRSFIAGSTRLAYYLTGSNFTYRHAEEVTKIVNEAVRFGISNDASASLADTGPAGAANASSMFQL